MNHFYLTTQVGYAGKTGELLKVFVLAAVAAAAAHAGRALLLGLAVPHLKNKKNRVKPMIKFNLKTLHQNVEDCTSRSAVCGCLYVMELLI